MTIINPNNETIPAMKTLRTAMDQRVDAGEGVYDQSVKQFCHMRLDVLAEMLNDDADMKPRQAYHVVDDILDHVVNKEPFGFLHTATVVNYIHGCKA